MPPAGLEADIVADFVADHGNGQPVVAGPHDLVPGVRIMLAGIIAQEAQFRIGEHQVGITIGHPASEQGHQHDAPCDHRIDGDGPLQPVCGAEQQMFHPATGFSDAKRVLDP